MKIFFRKENIQFSSRNFLPFTDFEHDAQTFCRIVGVWYNTYLWGVPVVRKPEASSFYTFLDTPYQIRFFFNSKAKDFFDKN